MIFEDLTKRSQIYQSKWLIS